MTPLDVNCVVTIRVCNTSTNKIEEHYWIFTVTTRKHLINLILREIKQNALVIWELSWVLCDKRANIVCRQKGERKWILNINQGMFFMSCSSHNENLILVDATKSSRKWIKNLLFSTCARICYCKCVLGFITVKLRLSLKPLLNTMWMEQTLYFYKLKKSLIC